MENIVRLYNRDYTVCYEVEADVVERAELHDLNWGPPMACTWTNGFSLAKCELVKRVDVREAKAFILECRAKKYVESPDTLPTDGTMFWATLYEGDVVELSYDEEATKWIGQAQWSRNDGESGCYDRAEFFGWSTKEVYATVAGNLVKKMIEVETLP